MSTQSAAAPITSQQSVSSNSISIRDSHSRNLVNEGYSAPLTHMIGQYFNESSFLGSNINRTNSFNEILKNLHINTQSKKMMQYFKNENVNLSLLRVGSSYNQKTGNENLYIYSEPSSFSLMNRNDYHYLQKYKNILGFEISNKGRSIVQMNNQVSLGITNITTNAENNANLTSSSNIQTAQSSQMSHNWDGYSNYNSINCISSASAEISAPGCSIPFWYSPCIVAPCIGVSSWVGISGSAGGTNCLAQTGYCWQGGEHHPRAFYEIYQTQATCLFPGQTSSNEIQNGNTIIAKVQHETNGFYFCVKDTSNNKLWSTTDTAKSFTPHYVNYIVEAPSSSFIKQIGKFSSIEFSNMQYNNLNFVTYIYDAPSYQYFYLSQDYDVQNIENNMNANAQTWNANYVNSDYNFYDVNGVECAGGGCIAIGSLILTIHGYRPIQEIKTGTRVYEFNYTSDKPVLGTLLYKNSTVVNETLSINHGLLRVTLTNQPIYIVNSTFQGWVINPDTLRIGDYMFNPVTNSLVKINSLKVIRDHLKVFDVITSLFNNFIDHGILLDRKICDYGVCP